MEKNTEINENENKENYNIGIKNTDPKEEKDISEAIKLKEFLEKPVTDFIRNNEEIQNKSKEEYLEKEKILNLFKELENKTIYIHDVKKFGNSILIGAFCNSITFITFGVYKTRIISDEYTNNWTIMALFGGLGQITAGIMELMKEREFPSFLYLLLGIYCLSHYILRIMTDKFGKYDLCIYYIAFLLLSISTILYSIKTNLIYLLQTIFTSFYFLFNAIGEGINEYILIDQVAGSFQIISGLLSFYLFVSQIINSENYNFYLKTFPFDVNNNIDFIRQVNNKKPHKS